MFGKPWDTGLNVSLNCYSTRKEADSRRDVHVVLLSSFHFLITVRPGKILNYVTISIVLSIKKLTRS